MRSYRIAVLGAGSVGLGSAALLLSRGHTVATWSPGRALTAGTMSLAAEGKLQLEAMMDAAASCAEAVAGADAVLIAVPATAYRVTLEALAACLQPEQPVLISGHLSFGGLFLSRLLTLRGISAPVGVWGTTVVSGRRLAPDRVRLSNIRAEVDVAAVPKRHNGAILDLCRVLFDDRFRLRDDLLAVTLSNVNPQNHLAIALCNFTRIEKGEVWRQYANITPAVGRLMEALDAERMAIAEGFGAAVRSLRRHFHLSFYVPEGPVGEMAARLATGPNDPIAPATLNTRYVLEDAPFGLRPMILLGSMCGRPALIHEAGLRMLSTLYDRDLANENNILPSLGLDTLNPASLSRLVKEGWSA